jgi:hypothetical protein
VEGRAGVRGASIAEEEGEEGGRGINRRGRRRGIEWS